MKSAITASLLAALTLTAPAALAAENATKPMAGKPMGMMDDKQMAQMQDNMKRMQQQMDKIHQTKDPKERQKLMQEHMQAMQTNMQMMRGMGGGHGGGMAMGDKKGGMTEGDMMKRHEMMEKRMDMMQMMMEQMMHHGQMMQGMPPK